MKSKNKVIALVKNFSKVYGTPLAHKGIKAIPFL
jgi:hypothetical protein